MQKEKYGFLRLVRELAYLMAGLVFVILVFGLIKSFPYKYNPVYYINNVLFIKPVAENPLLAKTIFGKIGIRYRNDVVDNGVIFFGRFHRKTDETEEGQRVQLTEIIDIKTFRLIKPENDDCSICTYYQDKLFNYKVLEMSDGIYLHIYGGEPGKSKI